MLILFAQGSAYAEVKGEGILVTNKNVTGKTWSIPGGLAIGGMTSVLVTIVLLLILCKLIDTNQMQWENIGYGILTTLLSASFLGALTSCRKIKRQRLLVSLLSGTVYFAVLMCVTALFFGGQYEAVYVTAALVFGGSGAAGLLGTGEGSRRKRRSYR